MTKEERAGKTGQEGPNLISYNTVISALAMANGKMKLD